MNASPEQPSDSYLPESAGELYENAPSLIRPESLLLPLKYGAGWQEILEAPDTADYRQWLMDLGALTSAKLVEARTFTPWQDDETILLNRWMSALEFVAQGSIDPGQLQTMTQAEIVKTALNTFQTNIVEGMGWDEEGLVFTVPNLFDRSAGDEPVTQVDLRMLPRELEKYEEEFGDSGDEP